MFGYRHNRFTKEGGGSGGGSSGPTTTTVNNSGIPDYLQSQATTVSNLGVAAMNQPYQSYNQSGNQVAMANGTLSAPGQQVASLTAQQNTAMGNTMGMTMQPGFGQAASTVSGMNPSALYSSANNQFGAAAGTVGAAANNIANIQQPGQFNAATGATGAVMGSSWTNPGTASSFMNPYQQNVINVANTEAARNANIQQTYQDSQFAGAGAFGGSRQGVADAENARSLALVQANNEAQGLNQAYTTGQQQYNTQQGLEMQGAGQLATIGTQQINSQLGQQNALVNAGQAQTGVANGQASAATAQGNLTLNQGAQEAAIAGQTQNAQLGLNQAQLAIGNQVQAQNQTALNTAQQNFTNQQNYNMNQALMASSVLHGTPYSTNTTQQTYLPPVSTGAQLAGLGVAGVGAYNAATTGKKRGGKITLKGTGIAGVGAARAMKGS